MLPQDFHPDPRVWSVLLGVVSLRQPTRDCPWGSVTWSRTPLSFPSLWVVGSSDLSVHRRRSLLLAISYLPLDPLWDSSSDFPTPLKNLTYPPYTSVFHPTGRPGPEGVDFVHSGTLDGSVGCSTISSPISLLSPECRGDRRRVVRLKGLFLQTVLSSLIPTPSREDTQSVSDVTRVAPLPDGRHWSPGSRRFGC